MKQDLPRNSQVRLNSIVVGLFLPFSPVFFTESCSFCDVSNDLFSSPCTSKMTKLSLTVKTDEVPSGPLRREWVKHEELMSYLFLGI